MPNDGSSCLCIINPPYPATSGAIGKLDVVREWMCPFQFSFAVAEPRRRMRQVECIKQRSESRLALQQSKRIKIGHGHANKLREAFTNPCKQKGLLMDRQQDIVVLMLEQMH